MSQAEKLRDLIKKDPLLAIDELLELSKSIPSIQDNSISLYRQAQDLKIMEIQGGLSFEQLTNKRSQITSSALKITRDIEKLEQQGNSNFETNNNIIQEIANDEPQKLSANNWESKKEASIKIGITIAVVGGVGAGTYFLFDAFLILLLIILGGGILLLTFYPEGE